MTNERSCANCGVALEPDAPEGSICVDCANAAEAENTPTIAADGVTPAPSTGTSSIRVNAQPLFERIGDFEVLDKLGQGGMGAVYRARQVSLDRMVALKILPSQFQEDESFVGRFRREATVAASLNHPNLVRVYSSGEADGVHYIAMELVEGENLRQFLRRAGPVPPLHALRLCLGVARGLQAGWNKAQLIHRDIKPSNIYLAMNGDVKLGDLGLAKSLLGNTTGITHTGTAIGTPHYVSPEQARGDKVIDCRADIYSLGCTLYELLTGATPYKGSDPMMVMNMHVNSPPPAILKVLPQCPVPVARLVGKMLRKKPHERHQSYDELVAAMEAAIDQLENPQTGPSAVVQAWKEIGAAEKGFLPAKATAVSPNLSIEKPASAVKVPAATAPSAKSKALVWAGLAVAVLVLGALGFLFLPGSKPATAGAPASAQPVARVAVDSTPALLDSRAKVDAPKPATVNGPAPPWQDALDRSGAAISAGPDGWLSSQALHTRPYSLTNLGVRIRFRGTPNKPGVFPQINLRNSAPIHPNVEIPEGRTLRIRSTDKGFPMLGSVPITPPLESGQEYTLEFYAIGRTLIAKVNGQTATAQWALPYEAGGVNVRADDSFRDFEVLNLDGLPEADALKLATDRTSSAPASAKPASSAAPGAALSLLPLVELPRDAVKGTWRREGDALLLAEAAGFAMSELPYEPPEEYDLEVEFTPRSEGKNVDLHLRAGGAAFMWKLNAYGADPPVYGFDLFRGNRRAPGLSTEKPLKLEVGRRYTTRVEVRRSGLRALVDGVEFLSWQGDFKDFSTEDNARLRNDRHLGLGSYGRSVLFHRADLRPLGGASAATPAADVRNFGGHRYLFVAGSVPWPEARARAEQMGGHLATINSKAEDDWLKQTFCPLVPGLNANILLGAFVSGGKWTWVTGEPFTYTGWLPGLPDKSAEGMPLQYWRKNPQEIGWDDRNSNTPINGFIVEWDDASSTSPTPAAATKEQPFVNSLGMKFVPVPITGGPTNGQRVLFSIWETRVQDYEPFAKETGREWPKPEFEQGPTHPAVNLTYDDARLFCNWLTNNERKAGRLGRTEAYRLPSDHEWSCAVGIGDREDRAAQVEVKSGQLLDLYPWGSAWPPPPGVGNLSGEEAVGHKMFNQQEILKGWRDPFVFTAPVGSSPANPLGLFDLEGNVREWCGDLVQAKGGSRVLRGGSFVLSQRDWLSSSNRQATSATGRRATDGFRVVLTPEQK